MAVLTVDLSNDMTFNEILDYVEAILNGDTTFFLPGNVAALHEVRCDDSNPVPLLRLQRANGPDEDALALHRTVYTAAPSNLDVMTQPVALTTLKSLRQPPVDNSSSDKVQASYQDAIDKEDLAYRSRVRQ